MPSQRFCRVALLMLTFLPYTSSYVQGQQELPSYLRPAHGKIIQRWLSSRADLRLATDADNINKDGLAATRKEQGRNYHPYYAVGDFNGDGKEDFAVAFVKTRKSKLPFLIAVFNGPLSANSVPSFTSSDDLSSGGIFYKVKAKSREGRLLVGVFESDDCAILRPRGKTFAMKNY